MNENMLDYEVDYNLVEKEISDLLEISLDATEEHEVDLGFTVICRRCDNSKNIVYGKNELYDGESIDITDKEIYCTVCGNRLI